VHRPTTEKTSLIDLSQIDFEAIEVHFNTGRKRTEAEKLKRLVNDRIVSMVQPNKPRTDLMENFKKLIEDYNKEMDVEVFFAKLTDLVKELSEEEEQRGVAKQLSE